MRLRYVCAAVTAIVAAVGVIATSPVGAQSQQSGDTVLKIGWAQNPKTLNPFVGQDEEDFSIWAINWDLLVNFSPKDLTPVPGIAESWDISDDKKVRDWLVARTIADCMEGLDLEYPKPDPSVAGIEIE